MKPIKLVVIGAGSRSFGLSTISTLLREKEMQGSTLALVDLDAEALDVMYRIAQRMNSEWETGANIVCSTDRTQMLPGADFCVTSIEKGNRSALWRLDYRVPLKHGVRQPFSENGGPAGFAHFARQIPPILDIARDMERLCPDAWLLNFSNPVPRITRAVRKYTQIKAVGLCHQVYYVYRLAGRLMADLLDLQAPETAHPSNSENWAERVPPYAAYNQELVDKLDIKAAGLNHFTWVMEMRDRRDGSDLLPEYKRRFEAAEEEPLMRDMMRLTGMAPVPGDIHLAEYLPFCHNPAAKPWERYHVHPPSYCFNDDERPAERPPETGDRLKRLTHEMAAGQASIAPAKLTWSEGVWEIVHGITTNDNGYHLAVNIPNHGSLPDLPYDSVVEVPAVSCASGLRGLVMGRFAPVVAELLRRETNLVELVVDAGVKGDRQIALQALMMDPIVDDYEAAKAILNDYLEEEGPYLPQFHGQWT